MFEERASFIKLGLSLFKELEIQGFAYSLKCGIYGRGAEGSG